MTKDPEYDRLRELSWRRKLSAAEIEELRSWFAAHPGAQADFETEAALNTALENLPKVLVSSNFTERVLQSVAREAVLEARTRASRRNGWRLAVHWLPRVAVAAAVVVTGLSVYELRRAASQRAAYVQSLMAVSRIPSLPSPEILEDFEAIRAVNPTRPDTDLLAILE
jgi:hypothetical protein